MKSAATLKTWTTTQAEEDRMYDGHIHHWQAMIDLMSEQTLQDQVVMDYGCNQGGFLRHLYKQRPFLRGVGLDIAEDSLKIAENRAGNLPVSYATINGFQLKPLFDIAFSHEVIYLLPDLNAHAQFIRESLKPAGVYYAATGCHTENPLWENWHGVISAYSNIPVPNYRLCDFISAFESVNFIAEYRPMGIHGFIKSEPDDPVYFPATLAKAEYYARHKILFRFTRKPE